MSTCSTTTSAHRDLRRRLFHDGDDAAAGRRLETRMRDLERDWHAYKASRRPHRRSRSATPSSAVTAAAGGPVDGDGLAASFLRCSPRRLVCSIQHQDGGSDDADSAGAVKRVDSGGRRHGNGEGDAPSVGSVQVSCPASSEDSSCSCPRHRARAALRRSYSASSSSCSVATESSLSPPARAGVVVDTDEHSTNTEEGRLVAGHNNRVRWFAAIALVVVAGVVVAMMAVVVELGMDEEEFLVPT